MSLIIRKSYVFMDKTHREGGRSIEAPREKWVSAIVIANPYAGQFVEDLSQMLAWGAEVGQSLVDLAADVMGARIEEVSGYGKGAIVGLAGELEHAAALIHPKFGAPVRAKLGRGPAIIPSTKRMGGAGASLTIPITSCDDIWSFTEMDAVQVTSHEGPKEDEIYMALALAIGGRPLARI